MPLAAASVFMPFFSSGALNGFVRKDKTDLTVAHAALSIYSTECAITARL